MRVLPDIAADAGLSVMLVAGMQADVQQGAAGTPIGFANPAIYALYGTAAYHDVTRHSFDAGLPPDSTGPAGQSTPGSPGHPYLITFGQDETLNAGPGYDDTTGVGTPTARYFWSSPKRQRARAAFPRLAPRS